MLLTPDDTPALMVLLAAPFIGSFAGTLGLRLPAGEPVLMARSVCPHCGATLGPRDLIPLVSYLWSRGKCRHCGVPIAAVHPVAELMAVAVALSAALLFDGADVLIACALGWTLVALAIADWDSFILPDVLTLPLVVAGLAATWWQRPDDLLDHAVGAVVGFVALAGIGVLYRRLRRRDGIGLGDAKLLAAAGAWLGWAALPTVVLLGAVAALTAVLGAVLLRRGPAPRADTPLPFGSWLALGLWLAYLLAAPEIACSHAIC